MALTHTALHPVQVSRPTQAYHRHYHCNNPQADAQSMSSVEHVHSDDSHVMRETPAHTFNSHDTTIMHQRCACKEANSHTERDTTHSACPLLNTDVHGVLRDSDACGVLDDKESACLLQNMDIFGQRGGMSVHAGVQGTGGGSRHVQAYHEEQVETGVRTVGKQIAGGESLDAGIERDRTEFFSHCPETKDARGRSQSAGHEVVLDIIDCGEESGGMKGDSNTFGQNDKEVIRYKVMLRDYEELIGELHSEKQKMMGEMGVVKKGAEESNKEAAQARGQIRGLADRVRELIDENSTLKVSVFVFLIRALMTRFVIRALIDLSTLLQLAAVGRSMGPSCTSTVLNYAGC